jgi:hypothetical protein
VTNRIAERDRKMIPLSQGRSKTSIRIWLNIDSELTFDFSEGKL